MEQLSYLEVVLELERLVAFRTLVHPEDGTLCVANHVSLRRLVQILQDWNLEQKQETHSITHN